MLIPVVKQSVVWACSWLLIGIVGSNPAGGIDVCLLCVLFVADRELCNGVAQRSRTKCGVSSVWSWCLANEEALAH